MGIGLFGGTFDPVHKGHIHVAREVLRLPHIQTVFFIPAFHPPHKTSSDVTPYSMRLQWLMNAPATVSGMEISRVEEERSGVSYTVTTVKHFRETYPAEEMYLVLGMDMFLDLPEWKSPEAIIREVSFIVFPRGNVDGNEALECVKKSFSQKTAALMRCEILNCNPVDISSTAIRDAVRSGRPIDDWVPPEIRENVTRFFSTGDDS